MVRFIESLNAYVLHQFPSPGILSSGPIGFAFGFYSHTFAKYFDFWSRKSKSYGVIIACLMHASIIHLQPYTHYHRNSYHNKDHDDKHQDCNNPS